ncbi:MATE family efflux transporter [Psychrobacter sanguinis]|uniref:MATE family efflux transporter n=1 Tax=Psychrobacter sanguinis TaxID=861445 RepID=UPI00191A9D2A|nr:MATE family efflux transporter [Psychrobacter sanguinis]MCC3345965.1 lipopolysaccharide biosynthesis protein [Psychrobacter sanguinis]
MQTSPTQSDNQRIANNTAMLLLRMSITMGVSLYTSRVVLLNLGVEDFGIYNVVAGFIAMIGFLYGAMSSATQRFLSFEIGKGNNSQLKKTFNMSLIIHIIIAVLIGTIAEIIGSWFIRNYLNIPVNRIDAATTVFNISLLTFMINIINVPYNALIISHERMSVFAWLSIVEASLKLLTAFLLTYFFIDKLIFYSYLLLGSTLLIFLIYKTYCNIKFDESAFKFDWDNVLFKTLLSFLSWNLWHSVAKTVSDNGVNILLNIGFGPSINAAKAISSQVSGATNHFGWAVQVAVNPQIIKLYASNQIDRMHLLVTYGAKYNFFILIILSSPLLIRTDDILDIWLVNPPQLAAEFIKIALIIVIIESLSATIITAAQATGNIKAFQSIVSFILLLNLPAAYIALKLGADSISIVSLNIIISLLAFIVRLYILRYLTGISVVNFFKQTILRIILIIFFLFFCFNYLLLDLIYKSNLFISLIIIVLTVLISILLFGLSKLELNFIMKKFKKYY